MLKGRGGASGFGYASTAEEVTASVDLSGKRILVTGSNAGLGHETGRVLAARGAQILAAARTREKAIDACRAFGTKPVPLGCELSEPASVRACVDEVRALGGAIDVIICNAGIMALPERTVRHGQELQFLTNHIGHFILVTGLLPLLSASGRVVVLSSGAHRAAPKDGIQFNDLTFERRYTPWAAYGHSKLANLLFARALARRFAGTNRTANALHPGVIATNLTRHMNLAARTVWQFVSPLALKSIPEGAATQCYLAARPELAAVSGEYFSDCNLAKPSHNARDDAMGERLWTLSEQLVAGL